MATLPERCSMLYQCQRIAVGQRACICVNAHASTAARCRDWRAATAVLEGMEADGCPPSIYCFNGVISALGEAGQWEAAVAMLDTMRAKGVQPSVVNHNAAIDACAKAGQWERAVDVFRSISEGGLLPDLVSYNSGERERDRHSVRAELLSAVLISRIDQLLLCVVGAASQCGVTYGALHAAVVCF
jgi:pentatricopeptide repeat protein